MFHTIISLDNLFSAWSEFRKTKTNRSDILKFELNLEDELFNLHEHLKNGLYCHGKYFSFYINDPKRRHIHKACVRDRVLHHAIVRVIEPLFDNGFINDSWSCRIGKGTHRAVDRLEALAWRLSRNDTRTVWAMKLDIRKFFASIDHIVLFNIISKKICDLDLLNLIKKIINSFDQGLPLGNITSQLFANVYLNQLDQFVKHQLKVKDYLRYADDFILLSNNRDSLVQLVPIIELFLKSQLKLDLHQDKIIIRKYHSGIDFLGYVSFPHHRIIRTKSKHRLLKKVEPRNIASYMGVLQHCRSRGVQKEVQEKILTMSTGATSF